MSPTQPTTPLEEGEETLSTHYKRDLSLYITTFPKGHLKLPNLGNTQHSGLHAIIDSLSSQTSFPVPSLLTLLDIAMESVGETSHSYTLNVDDLASIVRSYTEKQGQRWDLGLYLEDEGAAIYRGEREIDEMEWEWEGEGNNVLWLCYNRSNHLYEGMKAILTEEDRAEAERIEGQRVARRKIQEDYSSSSSNEKGKAVKEPGEEVEETEENWDKDITYYDEFDLEIDEDEIEYDSGIEWISSDDEDTGKGKGKLDFCSSERPVVKDEKQRVEELNRYVNITSEYPDVGKSSR